MDEDMDDVRESLEDLINQVTALRGSILPMAMEVVNVLQRTPNAAHIAVRLMASKIQSMKEQEALNALTLLDLCMKECGASFQTEVGKFRFLNELIKIVSPKYLGNRTPPVVRQKVLTVLFTWTKDYAHETKILEAYEMLKKQGVISKDDISSTTPRSIFDDDERSRLLQKLLQSKNPDDLQAANRLIKTMVKEDERRVEVNTRRLTELETIRNTAKLLAEMLDSYNHSRTSDEDLELIKEVYQSCEILRPVVIRLASEMQDNETMLKEVLNASDFLSSVLAKYQLIVSQGGLVPLSEQELLLDSSSNSGSLLDLSFPGETIVPRSPSSWIVDQMEELDLEKKPSCPADTAQQSDLEVLGDIFGRITPNESSTVAAPITSTEPTLLQPVSLLHTTGKSIHSDSVISEEEEGAAAACMVEKEEQKVKGLSDLDILGETMLKDNLPPSYRHQPHFSRSTSKIPMNLLGKYQEASTNTVTERLDENPPALKPGEEFVDCSGLELLCGAIDALGRSMGPPVQGHRSHGDSVVDVPKNSAHHSDTTEGHSVAAVGTSGSGGTSEPVVHSEISAVGYKVDGHGSEQDSKKMAFKSLADISVSLNSIVPAQIPPLPILEERDGLSVILYFTEDTPQPDVSVVVVTTLSRNALPISNLLFQAVVPKTCKIRLLPASGTDLPAHNPFIPPSAVTQVMLIANPEKVDVYMKYMISYMMGEEIMTEKGEVHKLPLAT